MDQLSYRKVWQLAGPNIISNILMVSISFAHLWIVAPLGSEASAAVVTGGRIHFLLMAAAMALSVATTAVVARAWGAEDTSEASAATTSSLSLSVFISIILGSVTYLCADQMVGLFKLDPASSKMAADYIRPTAILNIVFAITLTIATSFRAIGDVMRPLVFTAYSTILGILGSYAFLYGKFGLPELGISGIPWGTGLGQSLVLLWFFLHWLTRRYVLKPKPSEAFNGDRLSQLIQIGAPAALEQILIQSSFLLFMMLVAGYGTAAFAAYGIGITVLSVCIVVGLGFGTASATLAGQHLGALDPEGAIANGWMTMRLAIICMTIMALITYALKTPLAAMLSIDPEVRAHTEYFILILAVVQPLMAIEFAIGGALRGAGDTRYPLFVTFAGMIVGRLSIGFAVAYMGYSVEVMYAVIIADYAIKALLLVLRFRSTAWLEAAGKHLPLAVQSVAGVGREPVRAYAVEHPEE
ncbi:MATE family efflux transporter [Kordiimonas sp. SCSIO 12603]|uniref:MATE family efflux transporter n=1 Tax=Kordiimonas sp. SCSIO 12603 TaxID=2829596 RepID=UPI0021084240|nr:MATE family efflux transporter [Kordiimonas sp. SCSIO 12603]UTW57204.1 MATE family efflux transporter [Kordiimonas sp. SCSIO 12603]